MMNRIDIGNGNRAKVLSSAASSSSRTIVIIPGFTCPASFLCRLVKVAKLTCTHHVVVVELPFQGTDARPHCHLRGEKNPFPDIDLLVSHVQAVLRALAKTNPVPPILCGYSLGGGIALQIASRAPRDVKAIALLSPASFETLHDDFHLLLEKSPRRVHAWETAEEMEEAFTRTMGGISPKAWAYVPSLIVKGMVRERARLGSGYYSEFARIVFANKKKGELAREVLPKLKDAALPVLLITGGKDVCIDSDKCVSEIADVLGPELCESVVLPGCGHMGAKGGGTFLDHAALTLNEFLSRLDAIQ